MTHPSLRIAALIALAVACAFLAATAVVVTALAVSMVNQIGRETRRAFAAQLWRARWLLAMVVVLNAFGTPGPAAAGPSWSPSAAGLELAAHRGATLVAMLGAVNLLLATTSTAALVAGIAGLARPLAALGPAPERVGARLAGALVALGSTTRALESGAAAGGWRAAVADRILAIESEAGVRPCA